MTMSPRLLALGCLLASSPALGASLPDLTVDVSGPGSVYVYDVSSYDVTVSNIGRKTASGITLTIALPATATSPTVHVMGDLGYVDSRCALSGTELECDLGSLKRGKSTTVSFDIELPQVAGPLTIAATVDSASNESDPYNNDDGEVADLLNDVVTVLDGHIGHNRHCTGTGLTSFFECTLYPSSISSHDIQFHAGGALSFVNPPATYSGTWSQPTPDSLVFDYYDGATHLASFEGYGVSADCFEGITTFPGSSWVAPYEVCLQ